MKWFLFLYLMRSCLHVTPGTIAVILQPCGDKPKGKTKDREDNRPDRQKRTTSLIMDNLALTGKLSNPPVSVSIICLPIM